MNLIGVCKTVGTREGILINTTVINKSVLASWLERLTDVDWSENSIYSLLNPSSSISDAIQAILSPKDPQDVPRAIKLLKLIAKLRNLDTSKLNPSECTTHRALSLLGELVDALIQPFIEPSFSISQQITSLAKFAHIACALFLKHESAFLPQHLYSDLQCMVRTAIFRVAHTKCLNPEYKVLLCLLGDDVLEVLFGRVRMIGGHSPNVSAEEMRNRVGSAIRLDSIFQKYPEWERRPRRLKLERSRDVDHLSPQHWTGDLCASTCDLLACWDDGVQQAEMILEKHGYPIDFKELFHDWHLSGVDLMRPKGGKYPGISAEVDRSLVQEMPEPDAMEDIELDNEYSFRQFDAKLALEVERAADKPQRVQHEIWILLENGKPAHKKTILRYLLESGLDIEDGKSSDRLLRVRYFSDGGSDWDKSKSPSRTVSSDNVFQLGSLYASESLVSFDQTKVVIAILQCTLLKSGSEYLNCAPLDEISLHDSAYDVSGQILSFIPLLNATNGSISSISWVWDAQYVALNPPAKSKRQPPQQPSNTTTRLRHLSFAVNGSLVYPLTSSQISSIFVNELSLNDLLPDHSIETTWIMADHDINEIKNALAQRVQEDDDLRQKIPVFGQVHEGKFPYSATYS
jgi:hypothetical protein